MTSGETTPTNQVYHMMPNIEEEQVQKARFCIKIITNMVFKSSKYVLCYEKLTYLYVISRFLKDFLKPDYFRRPKILFEYVVKYILNIKLFNADERWLLSIHNKISARAYAFKRNCEMQTQISSSDAKM